MIKNIWIIKFSFELWVFNNTVLYFFIGNFFHKKQVEEFVFPFNEFTYSCRYTYITDHFMRVFLKFRWMEANLCRLVIVSK